MSTSSVLIYLVFFTSVFLLHACGESNSDDNTSEVVNVSSLAGQETTGNNAGTSDVPLSGTQAGIQAGVPAGMQAGTQMMDETTQIQMCEQQCLALSQCENLRSLCGNALAQDAQIACQSRCTQSSWREQFIVNQDLCEEYSSILISALDLAEACLAQSNMCTNDNECSLGNAVNRCEGDTLILNRAICQNQVCTVVEENRNCIAENLVCRAADCVEEEITGIQVGDLLISEVMYNPDILDDELAEWVEIYNVTNRVLDLSICTVVDSDIANETALSGLQILPQSYLLLAASADATMNGGIQVDGILSFKLSNGGDRIRISCAGELIDEMSYDDGGMFPKAKGSSLSLSADSLDSAANDEGASWCLGEEVYWGNANEGNRGTPGRANPLCPPPSVCNPNPCMQAPVTSCEGDVVVRYQSLGECLEVQGEALCDYPSQRQDCQDQGFVCLDGACVPPMTQPPLIGELVVSEIMYNPTHENDSIAEYIELYNVSNRTLDLSSCLVRDQGNSESVIGPVELAAGQYMLVGRNADASYFGGVQPQAVFNFGLNNDNDSIQVICDQQLVDEVIYGELVGFPEAIGTSLQLSPELLNVQSNDLADSWCLSNRVYVADNLGTPGRANHACPQVNNICDDSYVAVINQPGTWEGDFSNRFDLFQPGCADSEQGSDIHYRVVVDQATTICANTFGTDIVSSNQTDTVLYVRTQCNEVTSELACQDDFNNQLESQIQWQAEANVAYDLIVDTYSNLFANEFQLNVTFAPCTP